MLRRSAVRCMRLPKARRPRERPFEIFNTRDYGRHEGGQNLIMWLYCAGVVACLSLFEFQQMLKRFRARGDTCPACEASRHYYRERIAEREREAFEEARYARNMAAARTPEVTQH